MKRKYVICAVTHNGPIFWRDTGWIRAYISGILDARRFGSRREAARRLRQVGSKVGAITSYVICVSGLSR